MFLVSILFFFCDFAVLKANSIIPQISVFWWVPPFITLNQIFKLLFCLSLWFIFECIVVDVIVRSGSSWRRPDVCYLNVNLFVRNLFWLGSNHFKYQKDLKRTARKIYLFMAVKSLQFRKQHLLLLCVCAWFPCC